MCVYIHVIYVYMYTYMFYIYTVYIYIYTHIYIYIQLYIYIYYIYIYTYKTLSGQLNNDYKSCLQTAKLFHGQVVAISLIWWQFQLLRASGQVEFRAPIYIYIYIHTYIHIHIGDTLS